MDWMNELADMEQLLIKDLKRLNEIKGKDEDSELLRALLKRMIELRVKGIDLVFEDYLCGRNSTEIDMMKYQVRIKLPVFSHLKSLLMMSKTNC